MDHYWVGLYALEITGGNHPKSTYSLRKGYNLTLFGIVQKVIQSYLRFYAFMTFSSRCWKFLPIDYNYHDVA